MHDNAYSQFLKIKIESDKSEYRPRQDAKYVITITDKDGKPVKTEISLGFVDESIYALAEETTQDIRKAFYGKRWNRVANNSSFYQYSYGLKREVAKSSVLATNRVAFDEAEAPAATAKSNSCANFSW